MLKTCLAHSIHDQGRVTTCRQGIPLGSPLSPLLGALFLQRLDDRLTALRGVYYLRYMDDWVILAPTRWKLRKAIVCMNQTLAELCVEKHPDKTFIGRTTVGFDFLGYHFQVTEGEEACEGTAVGDTPPVSVATPLDRPSRDKGRHRVRLGVSTKTLQNFKRTCSQLYEQHASLERVGVYVKRWLGWFLGGLGEVVVGCDGFLFCLACFERAGTEILYQDALDYFHNHEDFELLDEIDDAEYQKQLDEIARRSCRSRARVYRPATAWTAPCLQA